MIIYLVLSSFAYIFYIHAFALWLALHFIHMACNCLLIPLIVFVDVSCASLFDCTHVDLLSAFNHRYGCQPSIIVVASVAILAHGYRFHFGSSSSACSPDFGCGEMDSDDEEVVVAVCHDPSEADDDLVVARPDPSASSTAPSRPRGRRWEYKTTGSFWTCVVVDAGKPSPAWLSCDRPPAWLEAALASPENSLCIGVASCCWKLVPPSAEAIETHASMTGPSRAPVGFLEYEVIDLFALEHPVVIDTSQTMGQKSLPLSRSCQDLELGEHGVAKHIMSKKEKATFLDLSPGVVKVHRTFF